MIARSAILRCTREKIPLSQIHLGFEKYKEPESAKDDDIFWPAMVMSGVALGCTIVLGLAGDKEIVVKKRLEDKRANEDREFS